MLGKLNNMKSSISYNSIEVFLIVICLFASSFFIRPTLSQIPLPCNFMYCGQGKCVTSNSSVLGVDCECNLGWKKLIIAGFPLPPCLLPNCTVDLSCSSTQQPPPIVPTPKNCELVWCDMGQCITNGSSHICQCVEGADNLFGNPEFACLSQCALGSDCKNVTLGSGPPSPSTSDSPPNGSKGGGASATRADTRLGALAAMLLSAIFILWI